MGSSVYAGCSEVEGPSSAWVKFKVVVTQRVSGRVASVALILSLLFGCALAGGGPASVSPEQRAAYDAAMGNLPANSIAAATQLEAFIARFRGSPLADDALEQLAQIAFANGRQVLGMRHLGRILSDYRRSDRAAPARLRLAQLEYARDRAETARRLLDSLELRRLALPEQRAALRLRIALARTPVERMEQLSLLATKLREVADSVRNDSVGRTRLESRINAVDRELAGLITSSASGELEAMLSSLRRRSPASAILLELSRRALDSGQLDLAARRIDRADAWVRSEMDRGQLRLQRERLGMLRASAEANAELPSLRDLANRPRPRTQGASGTIGVVLPLSGRFATFGQESLRGVLMATGLFDESDEPGGLGDALEYPDEGFRSGRRGRVGAKPRLRVVVRDSEGDPVRAAEAIRELAADPSVLAVVGPIFSDESLGAAKAAERMRIPLVTLSTREDVAAGRSQAFRIRTTPADEVRVLVDHAFEELKATRFAVLYPETRYGRGMRKLYWDAVTARGGKMVAASSYDADATDFSSAIRDMIGYRFLTNLERRAIDERKDILRAARRIEPTDAAILREALYPLIGPEGELLPPIIDFDVLFIPDAAETIALIAPGLAFHEITGVKLLGSNEWVDEELLRVARRHVRGSIIATPFYAESDLPIVAEFVQSFRKTFGEIPTAYSAQAFDATNLILVQLASGLTDRSSLREGLLDTRAYPGATGVLTMRPDGNARRRPFLLSVSGRRFRSLD
jgi:ABC-type branched-subunit amino acid transport system substrate-binding protein